MPVITTLSRIALGLAALHVLVGGGIALVTNPEGWAGGLFYVALYAVPMLALGLMLRSSRTTWHAVAGWFALLCGLYYSLVVVGNWSGYTQLQAIFATAVTAPTVGVDLAIVAATVLRRPHRSAPAAPA